MFSLIRITFGLLSIHIYFSHWNLSMQEAKVFKELVLSDTAKALVHVFLAQRATSKVISDTWNTLHLFLILIPPAVIKPVVALAM